MRMLCCTVALALLCTGCMYRTTVTESDTGIEIVGNVKDNVTWDRTGDTLKVTSDRTGITLFGHMRAMASNLVNFIGRKLDQVGSVVPGG